SRRRIAPSGTSRIGPWTGTLLRSVAAEPDLLFRYYSARMTTSKPPDLVHLIRLPQHGTRAVLSTGPHQGQDRT
ncbi:MAG: hypothetical protein OEY62_01260, partial [Acidimicrobiia bacterium]|nr:hypothetical protein [Acidimicrobiia bacterium]